MENDENLNMENDKSLNMEIIKSKKASGFRFILLFVPLALQFFFPQTAWGWGRQGHKIVGETAANLVAQDPNLQTQKLFKQHSFDLGFYCNVPDFIWKRPATYATEKTEHYLNLDSFNKKISLHPEVQNPFLLNRKELSEKIPEIKIEDGRALWRLRELNQKLSETRENLVVAHQKIEETKKASNPPPLPANEEKKSSEKNPTSAALSKNPSTPGSIEKLAEEYKTLQGHWLVVAGVMCHYIGDLAQPLHVSENYDGALTQQKGIHSYFEETCVDELYPQISNEVFQSAKKLWPSFQKNNSKKSLTELVLNLATSSYKKIPLLLKLDQPKNRRHLSKSAQRYHSLIKERLVEASLTLAEIYRRQSEWPYINEKFYFFDGEPAYIQPQDVDSF
ncbi:MAG: hypothetical protein K1X29_03090 [Bdellovibrionales bacterium]|nr:hypothetical protein [Bdellovibrionales bacterium]